MRKRLLPILTVALLSLTIMFVTAFASSGIASAHARPTPGTSSPPGCTFYHNGEIAQYCSGASVATSSWCHGQQYWPATDEWGNPMDYTLTDENNMCVTVTYTLASSPYGCDVYFYIPGDKYATAIFNYTWHDANGTHNSSQSINENGLAGWTYLFSDSSATSLSFTDNDSPGGQKLDWGSSSQFGVKTFCAEQ